MKIQNQFFLSKSSKTFGKSIEGTSIGLVFYNLSPREWIVYLTLHGECMARNPLFWGNISLVVEHTMCATHNFIHIFILHNLWSFVSLLISHRYLLNSLHLCQRNTREWDTHAVRISNDPLGFIIIWFFCKISPSSIIKLHHMQNQLNWSNFHILSHHHILPGDWSLGWSEDKVVTDIGGAEVPICGRSHLDGWYAAQPEEDGWGFGGKAELELTWQLISPSITHPLLCTHAHTHILYIKLCADLLHLLIGFWQFLSLQGPL